VGRIRPIHEEAGEGVVRVGVDEVVEQDQPDREHRRAAEGGEHGPEQVDAARAQSGDLVVLGQPPEGHEGRDEHRAGDRERDHEPERQPEQLQDGPGRHPPVDDEVEVVEQHVHLEDERHDREPQHEGNQMQPEDVGGEDAHGAGAYLMGWRRGTSRRANALTLLGAADTVLLPPKPARKRPPGTP
jgi:hypothetical protein